MQFDDETPTPKSDSQTGREVVPLRREVPMVERQRNALLAGVLSLAGVALGFGLGQFASANSNCPHSVIVHTSPHAGQVQTSGCAPASDMVTWLGVVVESHRDTAGAHITSVFPGSPAEAAGLRPGHRILSVNNAPILGARELIRAVRSHNGGQRVSIRLDEGGGQDTVRPVVLGQLSPSELQNMMPRRRR